MASSVRPSSVRRARTRCGASRLPAMGPRRSAQDTTARGQDLADIMAICVPATFRSAWIGGMPSSVVRSRVTLGRGNLLLPFYLDSRLPPSVLCTNGRRVVQNFVSPVPRCAAYSVLGCGDDKVIVLRHIPGAFPGLGSVCAWPAGRLAAGRGETARPGHFRQALEGRLRPDARAAAIRVLVPYSRTLYFVDKGRERGLTAELVRDFERYLNKKYAKELGKRPLTVYLIPTTRDKLLSGVVGRTGRHRRRQPDGDRRAAQDRRFHRAHGPQADAGAASSRAPSRRRSRRSTICPARPSTCARRPATTRACWR